MTGYRISNDHADLRDREVPRAIEQMYRDKVAAILGDQEHQARIAVRMTLRPRLRWAADHPKALKVLQRLRLWDGARVHMNVAYRQDRPIDRVEITFVVAPKDTD